MLHEDLTHRGRILVAEDDANLREIYADKLRRSGYDVISAGTAAQCLRAVWRRLPDVAVVDLDLVLGADPALLRRIVRHDPELPVLVNHAGSDREAPAPAGRPGPRVFEVAGLPQMLRMIRWLTSADAPSRRRPRRPVAVGGSYLAGAG